jgi:hypothetical protein
VKKRPRVGRTPFYYSESIHCGSSKRVKQLVW